MCAFDRWRVRNLVAKMRSFLTLPRADELGDPTGSRSCLASMCPVAFTGSLSWPCFPCGLRLLFNSPPQPLAECNQGMPVTQSERNLAGLLVRGDVGIGLVWFLDDLDATHNASPEENARTRRRLQAQMDVADRTRAASSLRRPEAGQPRSRSIASFTGRRLECNAPQVSWLSRPRAHHFERRAQPANRLRSMALPSPRAGRIWARLQ